MSPGCGVMATDLRLDYLPVDHDRCVSAPQTSTTQAMLRFVTDI